MNYEEFHRRFGGSARSSNRDWRGCLLPEHSELPRDFIRLDPWELKYLYGVAAGCRVGILEIGRLYGGSFFSFCCAAPDIPKFSIDVNPDKNEKIGQLLSANRIEKAFLFTGDSKTLHFDDKIDLLFVDGDHSFEGCIGDLRNWYKNVVSGGNIILHDCQLAGVKKAAKEFFSERLVEVDIVLSPQLVGESYWERPAGSLGHFIRK